MFVYLEDFDSKLNSAFGISRRIIKYHTFGPPPFPEKKKPGSMHYIYIVSVCQNIASTKVQMSIMAPLQNVIAWTVTRNKLVDEKRGFYIN